MAGAVGWVPALSEPSCATPGAVGSSSLCPCGPGGFVPVGWSLRSAETGHGAAPFGSGWLTCYQKRPVGDQGPSLVSVRSPLWTQGPLVLPWPCSWSLSPRASQKGPGLCPTPSPRHRALQGALRIMSLRQHTGPDCRCPRRPPEELDLDRGGDKEVEKCLRGLAMAKAGRARLAVARLSALASWGRRSQ